MARGKGLSREAAEALLYGGQSAVRFTQDTPALPDVWIQLAMKPDEAAELLLTPWQAPGDGHTTPGQLAVGLREMLETEHGSARKAAAADIAYNQTTVYARLRFPEVIRVALPLSNWWIRHERKLDPQSPLLHLGERDPAHPQCRAAVVAAFERLDDYTRPGSYQRMEESVRQRAARAFGPAAESAGAPDPAGAVRRADEAYEAFARAFEKTPEERQAELPPDVLWMVRVAGAIQVARLRSGADLAAWERLILRIANPPESAPRPRAAGEPAPTADPAYLAELRGFYEEIVRAVSPLLDGRVARPEEDVRIYAINSCRRARMVVSRSREAIKADAASSLFNISCRDIAWAIVDSGMDATHPAFLSRDTVQSRVVATYDFTLFRQLLGPPRAIQHPELKKRFAADPRRVKDLRAALNSGRTLDWELLLPFIVVPHDQNYRAPIHEHGTHVAGIIGADAPDPQHDAPAADRYRGMCPDIRLYDFRVLDEKGEGDEFNVMGALQFIRYLNSRKDLPVIHGVNLSLSIPHDVANYACGRTPVCDECERLVGAGVIVVAAAGNKGYLKYMTGKGLEDAYHSISITDPGNADGVLTVGATHRFEPHTYGISYFSSRGPTGDGRTKPDLVAPGEKIMSAVPGGGYKPMDGTSMAAPHVSGAAALLIARHRELLGQPHRVKKILCDTATDLGRERYFQGAGMVDVLRALQSV